MVKRRTEVPMDNLIAGYSPEDEISGQRAAEEWTMTCFN